MTNNEGVRDIGVFNPKEVKDGIAYASFGSFMLHDNPIGEETGHSVDVKVPIPVAVLEAAGVELDNPDPYDNPEGLIVFEASITTPVETVDQANPKDSKPLPHTSQEDIGAWEGGS